MQVQRERYRFDHFYDRSEPIVHGIDELLLMQSKGKFLTREEKLRVQKYADEQRKKRMFKKQS
jgi:hypothetical protein